MTDQYHQPDLGNRAKAMSPLKSRFPEWFGVHRLTERLARNRARRNKKWGKHAWNRNQPPFTLGVTIRDRSMIARSFG